MKSFAQLVLASVSLLALVGCGGGKDQTNVELIRGMMVSPAHKAQDAWSSEGGTTMLVPPDHTQPIGRKRYPLGPGDILQADARIKNPMPGENLERGENRYKIYCGVCHGMTGKGDGPVASKMPVKPPSLVSNTVKRYGDGRLYHIIIQGKGVMGSYESQLYKVEDRWAIVNYIRSLQAAN